MAIPAFGNKQSYEEYFITFDFFRLVASSVINSSTVIVLDADGEDVTEFLTDEEKQEISGSKINVWIRAGISGTTYKLTCEIITELGEQYEMDATLKVLDL
jgi:hypothetical protein